MWIAAATVVKHLSSQLVMMMGRGVVSGLALGPDFLKSIR